jgi:aryl-alcohol dehydrogenase-like predicted oxidoreductase
MAKGFVTNKDMTRRTLLAAGAGLIASGLGASPVQEYRRGGMVYRRLGQTDMYVSLLSFGSHTDPVDRIRAAPPRKNVLSEQGQARRDRIILRAFDMGVNLLDVYEEEGQWEPAARLVRDRRDKVLISAANENPNLDPERAIRLFGHLDLYRYQLQQFNSQTFLNWDKYRKAKEAGKIRALGIASHSEEILVRAMQELDGLDYVFFPYNFIQARGEYSRFLPLATQRGLGLIAMKPLASGSIMNLDPHARQGAKPEFERLQLFESRVRPILPAAVAELTKTLDRTPDETLCMAAMRFVYSRPFLSTAITGMFEERLLEDNYQALQRYEETRPEERAALDAARSLARLYGPNWIRREYRWLEEQWGV